MESICLSTQKEPIGRHKVWIQVTIFPLSLFFPAGHTCQLVTIDMFYLVPTLDVKSLRSLLCMLVQGSNPCPTLIITLNLILFLRSVYLSLLSVTLELFSSSNWSKQLVCDPFLSASIYLVSLHCASWCSHWFVLLFTCCLGWSTMYSSLYQEYWSSTCPTSSTWSSSVYWVQVHSLSFYVVLTIPALLSHLLCFLTQVCLINNLLA